MISPNLLAPPELHQLNIRISTNADKWLADNAPIIKARLIRGTKSDRGRQPEVIINPFHGFIGLLTRWGRYPGFASDIIEGIARLDWHDRPFDSGDKSMPLSVRKLTRILENLPIVSNESVEDFLQLKERHARRYVAAIRMIIPRMMDSRPVSLIEEMNHIQSEPKTCEWEDHNKSSVPSPEELEKLHYDLRTLTQYKSVEEYDEEIDNWDTPPKAFSLSVRLQHPKRSLVMQMLAEGASVKAIERSTGVSPKTIRKWRNEGVASESEQQAA
jgi:uncharacterized protein YerC